MNLLALLLMPLFANATAGTAPRLRRFPPVLSRAQEPLCQTLLMQSSARTPAKSLLFRDDDIVGVIDSRLDLGDASVVPVPRWLTRTSPARTVLLQPDLESSAQTAALMWVSGQIPVDHALPQAGGVYSTPSEYMHQWGYGTGVLELAVNTQQVVGTLEKLEDWVNQYGSLTLGISPPSSLGLGQPHWIVLDEVAPHRESVTLRDPYHGWAIELRGAALFRMLQPDHKVQLHYLHARPPAAWHLRLRNYWSELRAQWRLNETTRTLEGEWMRLEDSLGPLKANVGMLATLLDRDYRANAQGQTTTALNSVTEQVRLYSADSLEGRKLALAAKIFELRLLLLEQEKNLLEFAFESARHRMVVAEKKRNQARIHYLALNPMERTAAEYEGLLASFAEALEVLSEYERKRQGRKSQYVANAKKIQSQSAELAQLQASPGGAQLAGVFQNLRPFDQAWGRIALTVLDRASTLWLEGTRADFDQWIESPAALFEQVEQARVELLE